MNGLPDGRLGDPGRAERLLASARDTAAIGLRLGVARLNLHGTALGDGGRALCTGIATPASWTCALGTLHRVRDLGAELGVTFTLENLYLPEDHAGVPFARAVETLALALVPAVDRPELRLNLDLYHAQIGEGNLIELCRAALPWIGEIQVADVPGRCEPGTGEVNYPGSARALHAMGYKGAVGLESHTSGDPEAALNAFRAAFPVQHGPPGRGASPRTGIFCPSIVQTQQSAGPCGASAPACP